MRSTKKAKHPVSSPPVAPSSHRRLLPVNPVQDLMGFLNASPTSYHAAAQVRRILLGAKFVELDPADVWKVKPGGRYLVSQGDTALAAFVIGTQPPEESGFRLVGCHTDSPTFRIKPCPEMLGESRYLKLNTEVYGGPILATWLDRPLSIAGRVVLRGASPLTPVSQLVDLRRPVCIIPNLAIHMNREVNKGVELNRQIDMLPLVGEAGLGGRPDPDWLRGMLAAELGVKVAEIVDFDLFLYEAAPGCLVGRQQEFVSAGRIDDLAAVHAGLTALLAVGTPAATAVLACFDHEEVGSSTRPGADSPWLGRTIERLVLGLGKDREAFFRAQARSMLVSADGAHAVHPNRPDKADPTHRPVLNGGPVIKLSGNQRYTTDGHTAAIFAELCRAIGVPVQRFVNRSDEAGGSTIGPISMTQWDVPALDIGTPMLSMHSVRELAGARDHVWMIEALAAFFAARG
jgi:aspartyl aminopeptidase